MTDGAAHAGRRTFHWRETGEVLAEFAGEVGVDTAFRVESERRWFEGPDGVRVHPALVAPIDASVRRPSDLVAALPARLGRHLVVLLQAGATSLGLFEDEEAIATKSFKRYVVRGKGRAQPTHLRSKGKSRYGSRLRLQNAQAQLEETAARIADWWDEYGPAERVFFGGPVRLFASLWDVDPPPPFERNAAARIPRDLPRPTTEVLLLAQRSTCYGRIEPAS